MIHAGCTQPTEHSPRPERETDRKDGSEDERRLFEQPRTFSRNPRNMRRDDQSENGTGCNHVSFHAEYYVLRSRWPEQGFRIQIGFFGVFCEFRGQQRRALCGRRVRPPTTGIEE
jgi:hypothetical protein